MLFQSKSLSRFFDFFFTFPRPRRFAIANCVLSDMRVFSLRFTAAVKKHAEKWRSVRRTPLNIHTRTH